MGSASDKTEKKALLQAAKALSLAAASLASAAEALTLLCEDEGDDDDSDEDNVVVESGGWASINDQTSVASLKATSVVDYGDSGNSDDDDYMALAREALRVAGAVTTHSPAKQRPAETKPEISKPKDEPTFTVTLSDIQARFATRTGPPTTTLPAPNTPAPNMPAPTMPAPIRPAPTIPAPFMPPPPPPPIPVSTAGRKEDMFAPPPQDWQSWAGTPTNATPGGSNHGLPMKPPSVRGGTQNGSVKPNQSQRAETPTKVPFQNLTLNWSRPTVLQKQMLGPLRVGRDMLVYHGNMKSQAHAILVRCMQVLKQHNLGHNSNGIITALFIVPQQSTGRLYLNFANQLFSDFDLPCKAMLLPGGGSELAAEIEKMSSERIDILLSTPRVFINHVNGNPNISAHLAKVRMVVYPAAHELVKNEVFLSFQFNSIKKKMQSRSKAPRQIIIAANSPTDEIQTFAMRALNAGYDSVISAGSGDNLAEGSWVDLLRRR